jgi:hypothetical protein
MRTAIPTKRATRLTVGTLRVLTVSRLPESERYGWSEAHLPLWGTGTPMPSAVTVTVWPSARDLGRAQVQLYRAAALAAFGPACLRSRGLRRANFWDGCARPSDGAAAGDETAGPFARVAAQGLEDLRGRASWSRPLLFAGRARAVRQATPVQSDWPNTGQPHESRIVVSRWTRLE